VTLARQPDVALAAVTHALARRAFYPCGGETCLRHHGQPNRFCVSFYGWPHADKFIAAFRAAGFRLVGHFTFPKRYTSSRGYVRCQHECAYLLAKGSPRQPDYAIGDVIDWTYSGNRLHPTQKPLPVLLPLVETFSSAGGLVLDPFAGSGSSLLAARMLGRSYLGIELDDEYHAIARRRLEGGTCPAIAPGAGRRAAADVDF